MFDIFKNKKILITGHTGFKGTWLCNILYHYNAELHGYSLNASQFSLYSLLNANKLMTSECISDILNFDYLKTYINTIKPDIIFHLAAQPLVRKSYTQSKYTFDVNAIGTANVLECLKNYKKPCCVICITTDKVYINNELGIPFKEDDPLGGYDPYSASKAAAEIVIDSYKKSFYNPKNFNIKHKIQVASARAGNVIGGGDFADDRIIPDIVRSIQSSTSINIRNPYAIRPWQHVIEPLFGYIGLAANMMHNPNNCEMWSSAWNFGPNETSFKNVEHIVKTMIDLFGIGSYEILNDNNELHEAGVLKLDSNKAKTHLNWISKWNVDIALHKTYEIYNAIINNASSNELNELMIKQIKEYEQQ